MPRRERRADARLGEWLETRRLERPKIRRSYQAVANQLDGLGVSVDQSTLFRYHKEERMPFADVLWGLALVYGGSVNHLVQLALGQDFDPQSVPQQGRADAETQAGALHVRIRELEELLDTREADCRTLVDAANDVTHRLTEALARTHPQDAATARAEPSPRRRHRTARRRRAS